MSVTEETIEQKKQQKCSLMDATNPFSNNRQFVLLNARVTDIEENSEYIGYFVDKDGEVNVTYWKVTLRVGELRFSYKEHNLDRLPKIGQTFEIRVAA